MKRKKITTKQVILQKTKRVITIYLLLRERHMELDKISKKFKVSTRSIQRDIKLLKEAGAVVYKNELGYYVGI